MDVKNLHNEKTENIKNIYKMLYIYTTFFNNNENYLINKQWGITPLDVRLMNKRKNKK